MNKIISKKSAFSLIEMSISLIIIGIIVIAVFNGTTLIRNAKIVSRLNEVKAIENYLYMYYASTGHLPKAEQGDQMYFATNCEVWKTLSDNNVISEIKIDSCDVEDQEIINRNKSFPSKDKSLFYTVGYNKNLLRNTVYALSNSETAEPETAYILTNISHLPKATVNKANTASISNRYAYNIDIKSDNGEMTTGRIQSFSANNRTEECSYNNDKEINCIVSFGIGSLLSGDIVGCFLNDLQAEHADYDIIGDPTKTMPIGTSYTGQCKEGYRPSNNNEPVKISCKLSGSYGIWVEENPCRQDAICNKEDLSFPNTTFKETNPSTGQTTSGSSLTGEAREDTEIQGTCNTGYYADNEGNNTITATCNKDGEWDYKGGVCTPRCAWNEISKMTFKSIGYDNTKIVEKGKWYDESGTELSSSTNIQKPSSSKLFYDEGTSYQIACPKASDDTYTNNTIRQKLLCENNQWVVKQADNCYGRINYSYTGGQQTFKVPEGVDKVYIKVWGAQGGNNGGLGGYTYGIKTNLVAGNYLYVYVGGQGGSTYSCTTFASGGWNGGGNGYKGRCNGETCSSSNFIAAGGGGATDVRFNGNSLSHRIIVAGGGGGRCYASWTSYGSGGYGGGGTAYGGHGTAYDSGRQGYGASTGSGGSGGYAGSGNYGANGSLGTGGNCSYSASPISSSVAYISCGGGGGFFGGGGSADSGGAAGGGGGSGSTGGVTSSGGSSGAWSGYGYATICWGNYTTNSGC